jgi:hypothetical protein
MAHGRRQSPPGTLELKQRGGRYDAKHQDVTRQKLADSGVVHRLTQCLKGEIELSPSQVTIALKFLDKLVPNLASQEIQVTETQPFALLPAVLEDVKAWQDTFKPALPKPETEH